MAREMGCMHPVFRPQRSPAYALEEESSESMAWVVL